mgnify:CR=1 FL=1
MQGGRDVEYVISRPCGGKDVNVPNFVDDTVGYGWGFCNHPVVFWGSSHQSEHLTHLLNVPESGIYLTGNVGDTRSTMTRDVNVPQYDIKETVRETIKDRPYSVGVGYSPDENKDINLTFDDKGNVIPDEVLAISFNPDYFDDYEDEDEEE